MNVKQLYEILGKYIDIGAGEWNVMFIQRDRFKTRKEHRDWLKSAPTQQSITTFDVGEVRYYSVIEDDVDYWSNWVVLHPSLFIKDENKAFYYLPPEDFVKGNRDAPYAKMPLELVAKTGKRSKKGD